MGIVYNCNYKIITIIIAIITYFGFLINLCTQSISDDAATGGYKYDVRS